MSEYLSITLFVYLALSVINKNFAAISPHHNRHKSQSDRETRADLTALNILRSGTTNFKNYKNHDYLMNANIIASNGQSSNGADWQSPYHPALQGLGWITASFLSVATIIGNAMVIAAYRIERSISKQVGNRFIVSLAISDLIIGIEGIPLFTVYVINGDRWPLGKIACETWLFLDYTLCLISILTVLLITIDRYLSVCHTAKYLKWQHPIKIQTLIILSWLIPAVIFGVMIYGWPFFGGGADENTTDDLPPSVKRSPFLKGVIIREHKNNEEILSKHITVSTAKIEPNSNGECFAPFLSNPFVNMAMYVAYYWTTLIAMLILYKGIHKAAKKLEKKARAKEHRHIAFLLTQRLGTQVGVSLMLQSKNRESIKNELKDSGYVTNTFSTVVTGQTIGGMLAEPLFESTIADVPLIRSVTSREQIREDQLIGNERQESSNHSDLLCHSEMEEKNGNESEEMPANIANILTSTEIPRNCSNLLFRRSATITDRLSKSAYETVIHERYPSLVTDTSNQLNNISSISSISRGISNDLDFEKENEDNKLSRIVESYTIIENSTLPSHNEFDKLEPMPIKFETRIEDSHETMHHSSNANNRCKNILIDEAILNESVENESLSELNQTRSNELFTNENVHREKFAKYSGVELCIPEPSVRTSRRGSHQNSATSNNDKKNDNLWHQWTSLISRSLSRNTLHSKRQSSVTSSITSSSSNESNEEKKNVGILAPKPSKAYSHVGDESHLSVRKSGIASALQRMAASPLMRPLPVTEKRRESVNDQSRKWINLTRETGDRLASSVFAPINALNRIRKHTKAEKRAHKAFRTITFIVGLFAILWSPYYVVATIYGFCRGECVPSLLYNVAYYMCYLNSSLNPFAYALANRQFRSTFLRMFRGDFTKFS